MQEQLYVAVEAELEPSEAVLQAAATAVGGIVPGSMQDAAAVNQQDGAAMGRARASLAQNGTCTEQQQWFLHEMLQQQQHEDDEDFWDSLSDCSVDEGMFFDIDAEGLACSMMMKGCA